MFRVTAHKIIIVVIIISTPSKLARRLKNMPFHHPARSGVETNELIMHHHLALERHDFLYPPERTHMTSTSWLAHK